MGASKVLTAGIIGSLIFAGGIYYQQHKQGSNTITFTPPGSSKPVTMKVNGVGGNFPKNARFAFSGGPGNIHYVSGSLKTLLTQITGAQPSQISGEASLLNTACNLQQDPATFRSPDGAAKALAALEKDLHVKITSQSCTMNSAVLRAPRGATAGLKVANGEYGSMSSQSGKVTATAMPMSTLVHVISQNAAKPVVDETGLTGKYDFDLKYDSRVPGAILEAVRTQLGLEIIQEDRPSLKLAVQKA